MRVEQSPASASAEAGASDERAASAELAAGGGGTGRRRRLGEADATGGAAHKKPRSLCPHQRERRQCKECGGAGICQHQRRRSQCKECGGAGICQHQRERSDCKECQVQTTGEAAEDDEAGAFEARALALAPMQGPPQKRHKTVLTWWISLKHKACSSKQGAPA